MPVIEWLNNDGCQALQGIKLNVRTGILKTADDQIKR